MAKSYNIQVEIELPFCEDTLTVLVSGTYIPAEPAYTYPGEYAPTDPPEPASFEYDKIEWYDNKTKTFIDISNMIPIGSEDFVIERVIEKHEYEMW